MKTEEFILWASLIVGVGVLYDNLDNLKRLIRKISGNPSDRLSGSDSSHDEEKESPLEESEETNSEDDVANASNSLKEDERPPTPAELKARELSQNRVISDNALEPKGLTDIYNESKGSIKQIKPEMKNMDLLMDTLNEMGCQPQLKQDDSVLFKFQGENFSAHINHNFLRIWDLPFMEINMLDTNLSLVMEAINSANFAFGPVVVLGNPDENGVREIASRMDILFINGIPSPSSYLEAILQMFFETKHKLVEEIRKLGEGEDSSHSTGLESHPHLN